MNLRFVSATVGGRAPALTTHEKPAWRRGVLRVRGSVEEKAVRD